MRRLARLHGGYYVASGLWPIVSYRTFERVTGPKTDDWLVKTVGLLAAVVGGTLVRHGGREAATRDLAIGAAAAFAAVDTWYALRGRISRVYLADAAVEAALIVAWVAVSPGGTMSRARRVD